MGKFLNGVLWIAALLAVVVGAARLIAVRWWQIPADDPIVEASIAPTLRGGDWVLLWRLTPPGFGALAVCPDPEDESRVVVGRLIGEEGDQLTIEGERIQINDHDAQTETSCPSFHVKDPSTGSDVEQPCVTEAIGGVLHMRGGLTGTNRLALKTSRTVGEGKAFLVSDNRAYPYDSRNFGPVDRPTCKETILFRVVGKGGFMDDKSRLTYIR
jgi:signal peptidase I